jgi:hypothetical protein
VTGGAYDSARKKNSTVQTIPTMVTEKPRPGRILTQHTGLPPRETGAKRVPGKPVRKMR